MLKLGRKFTRLACAGMMFAFVVLAAGAGPVVAQTPAPPSEAAQPQPPAGVIVTPPRAVPHELLPDALRGGGRRQPQGGPAHGYQPHGGCRYDEQKLELIV